MKKIAFVLVLVFVGLIATGVIAANENDVFLPLLYGGPALAPPAETPTPTPKYVDGYNWVFVGVAYNDKDGSTVVWGHRPGYCYDLIHTKVEKTIYLEAVKIPLDQCEPWKNKDAPWPPPEFPPPTELPPEFDWGEIYKLVLDVNAKVVCSVYWPVNCVDVR